MATEAKIHAIVAINNAGRPGLNWRTTSHEPRATINMQNKPNLLDAQMNVNKVLTKDYGNFRLYGRRENKPNSKPIYAQTNPIYPYRRGNKPNFYTNMRKTKPIQTQLVAV